MIIIWTITGDYEKIFLFFRNSILYIAYLPWVDASDLTITWLSKTTMLIIISWIMNAH